jgi:hypothetical protein
MVGLQLIWPIINLLQNDSKCSMNCVNSPSHESINWVKLSFCEEFGVADDKVHTVEHVVPVAN